MTTRSYNVRITALTLGVNAKWLDNVLSHHAIPGVTTARQGVERSVSELGLRVLEFVRIAAEELRIPIARAVEIASIAANEPSARIVTPSGAEIRFAIDVIDRRLRERLMDAIEATPRLRRGRPPNSG